MLPDFRQWSTLSVIGILFNIFFFLIFSSFNPKVLKKIEKQTFWLETLVHFKNSFVVKSCGRQELTDSFDQSASSTDSKTSISPT